MSKNIKGAIPKWRFESFDSYPKWNIKKLGCLMQPINERAGDKKYVLMSVTSGVGLISQVEKFGREIAGNSYKNYYVIRKNDFAYNKSSTKEFPEGYISMLKEYEEAAIPNSIFTCFRIIDDEYEPLFFEQLFNTNYHGKWLRKYIEIGARAHGALSIDTKYLWNMPVAVPKLPEQQKIANCLSSIDDLISVEEKKLSLLNDYKKGWIQRLFPAEEKTVPEWRFPEFQDNKEWETAKLINIADYRRGSFPQPYGLAKWYDEFNGMPFIQVFDVDDNMRLKATTKNKISKLASTQSVFIRKGTLIVTLQGSIGRVAITQYDAYIDRTLLLFEKFYMDIDKVFFAYIIQRLFEIKKQSAPGGIIKTITKQALSEFTVKIPERPEQEKIAKFLSGIDDLISTQTDRIEALKQHKKALMQGLFPSIEEVL